MSEIVKSPISSDSSLEMEQLPMQTRTIHYYSQTLQISKCITFNLGMGGWPVWKTEITLIPVMQVVYFLSIVVCESWFSIVYLLVHTPLFISFRQMQYIRSPLHCSRSFCKFKWAIKLINSYDKTKSSS